MFKVGDEVISERFGEGVVIENFTGSVSEKVISPVFVEFPLCIQSFTSDGCYVRPDEKQEIFHKPVEKSQELSYKDLLGLCFPYKTIAWKNFTDIELANALKDIEQRLLTLRQTARYVEILLDCFGLNSIATVSDILHLGEVSLGNRESSLFTYLTQYPTDGGVIANINAGIVYFFEDIINETVCKEYRENIEALIDQLEKSTPLTRLFFKQAAKLI